MNGQQGTGAPVIAPGVAPGDVEAALGRIVVSSPFARSPGCRAFLTYVVGETLAGRGDQLNERKVARQALGRSVDFDAHHNPSVRVQASRLRRALGAYYDDEGRDDPIRIDVPPGRYHAVITPRDAARVADAEVVELTVVVAHPTGRVLWSASNLVQSHDLADSAALDQLLRRLVGGAQM